jgi:hypothetical protein
MASKGKRSEARRYLTELINHVRDFSESFDIIQSWHYAKGDDRSQAIIVSALLEQALEFALASHFVTSEAETRAFFADQDDGGLTFATKIRLALALGVIEEKIRSELTLIKNIRNVFAHTRASVSFEDPGIVVNCDLLKLAAEASGGLLTPRPHTAKEKFAFSVRHIYLYLASVDYPEKQPLRHRDSSYYRSVILHQPSGLDLAEALLKWEPPSDLPERPPWPDTPLRPWPPNPPLSDPESTEPPPPPQSSEGEG